MSSRNGQRKAPSKKLRVAEDAPPYLTRRELEVVEWIAAGKRNYEIGKIPECSPRRIADSMVETATVVRT